MTDRDGGTGSSRKDILACLFVVLLGFCVFIPSALAVTTLKQVQVTDGSQIDLLFDGKVNPAQIKTEFFNDIIQLSLNDVSVYPAKISSISGNDLSKVFVYQYAPKLVRCRLTVKGKAEDYQDRIQLKPNGKMFTIRIGGSGERDHITAKAAHAAVADKPEKAEAAPVKAKPVSVSADEASERALLERILKAAPAPAAKQEEKAGDRAQEKAQGKTAGKDDVNKAKDQLLSKRPLAAGKPLPSPFRTLGMLIMVLGVFGAFAVFLKKIKGGSINLRLGKGAGVPAAVGRWVKKSLGRSEQMIEVLATHYLGPKQSIVIVRVAGKTLVLGVSNDSINLITQFDGEAMAGFGSSALDDALADSFDDAPAAGAVADPIINVIKGGIPSPKPKAAVPAPKVELGFGDVLSSEQSKPQAPAGNVRAQIRSKLEAMKTL